MRSCFGRRVDCCLAAIDDDDDDRNGVDDVLLTSQAGTIAMHPIDSQCVVHNHSSVGEAARSTCRGVLRRRRC